MQGVPLFQYVFYMTKNYANSQPIGIESATVSDCQQQKIGCLSKVICSRTQLSAIPCIVNYWFYITVNNLYK